MERLEAIRRTCWMDSRKKSWREEICEPDKKERWRHGAGKTRRTSALWALCTTRRRPWSAQDIEKPNVVLHYNDMMGGVDKADQELTYYPLMHKQQKRYYKQIFRHPLDQSLWNAFVLFSRNAAAQWKKKVEHADLLWMAADGIFCQYLPAEAKRSWTPGRRSTLDGNPERLRGRHFVEYIPPTNKNQAPTRMCVMCCSQKSANRKKVRKETRYCRDTLDSLAPSRRVRNVRTVRHWLALYRNDRPTQGWAVISGHDSKAFTPLHRAFTSTQLIWNWRRVLLS